MPRLQEPQLLRDAPPVPAQEAAERRRYIERLKTYGFGVLIGCVIAAMLFLLRAQMNLGQPTQPSPTPAPASAH
ncbi:MAG: hypothetical protein ACREJO_11410 [Phycisphaerales bacterium]